MKLQVGERLEGAGPEHQPGGYVITSIVRETPWHGVYTGKKIFYNFDFTAKRVRETDELEWLDVFIRTNRYPILDDPAYVQQRRALARAEVRAILGNRHSNLWPEPLDLLEIDNTRDRFAFADNQRGNEPVVVYTRPQGRFTADWQQQILPISSVLSVLAELLEFLKQAHAEGLLLLGLGPASLLIDASDRIHYIGTEMVLAQQSPLLKDATPAAVWQRLFPADRFTRGYAAPECFDPAKRPDARADLYAWGTFAFSLIAGIDLIKIAHEQGRPWIDFNEAHWKQLEKMLTQLPRNALTLWAEQLGVEPAGFLQDWPRNFLTAFRLLLSRDPTRRPRTVADLLTWVVSPPPPPVAGVIALHTDADMAKLLIDCAGADTGLEMTVQCSRHAPAQDVTVGTKVAEGPLRPQLDLRKLPLTTDPIYYTVFTRRKQGNDYVHSPGIGAHLWQPTEQNLRTWIEEQAAGALDGQQIPPRVSMVLGVVDVRSATESLLASPVPRVRAWGLRRVEQMMRTQGRTEALESLLWRFLADPNVEVRQSAATTLWTFHPQKTDALLLRLVEALEALPVDAPVPLMHFLRQLQLPEERIRGVWQQVESKRPTECPICRKTLTIGSRTSHLQTEHGYLYYQGDLLPASAVFAHLWERAFQQQDRHAHEELVGMYTNLPETRNNPTAAANRYVADLREYLLGETKTGLAKNIPIALPYESVVAYQTNLRLSKLFLPIARQLLGSPQRRLRDLGAQSVLPYLLESLPVRVTVEDVRRRLNTVCGDLDHTDLQIELCRQLGQQGIDQNVVGACIAQLQDERLVVCSECKSEVQMRDFELHLRRAHQIFQFRGTRKPYVDIRESMLKAVCTPPADVAAWKSLEALAADKHPQETERFLVAWLYQYIKEVPVDQRGMTMTAVTELLIAAGAADRLLSVFVGPSKNASWEQLGYHIALELIGRLPGPVPATTLPLLLPLLDNKDLPRRSRENAVLAMLRALGKDSPQLADVLRAYVAQSSKKRGVEKLQQLEQRFGHAPMLDRVTQEIDGEIRMSCPRCPTELRKKEMVGHLWDKHHLVLDGERVREPWRVIEDWVVDYGLEKDPAVLQRCRELAAKDDPQTGLAKLQRLLYRRGLRDRDLLFELRALVKSRKSTLCPHCCATMPIADRPAVDPLKLDGGRLHGYGYVAEVREGGLVPSLRLESPDAILFNAREPGRTMTRLGGILLFVIPVMGIVYFLTRLVPLEVPAVVSAAVAVGVGLLWTGFLFLAWPSPGPARLRLVKAVWNLLVPEILREKKKGRKAWNFLHGLMELSDELAHFKLNEDLLLDCCEKASDAGVSDPWACICLARLSRRYLADRRDHGEPWDDFVLTLASECFKGKLPLSFLSDLLANFHGAERSAWSKSDLNRLPILIAHQAFSADVDVDDWFNLGRAFPVLNVVLNLEARFQWLQFHALWVQRNRKPWEAAGAAVNMLDLAKSPRSVEELLSFYPDVLLYVAKANLVIGGKGVWIEGVCVTGYQIGTEIFVQRGERGHELKIGTLSIRCTENPRPYLDEIRRWLRWYFLEFLPTVSSKPRPLTESRHRMWPLDKVACPECVRLLVACPGDLGVGLK
ncbi:MAG: hypothetical protein HY289_07415 [Planctomycetes bacterium]|nr:hypothetical protein [Planctomycetota bacterium]